MSNDQHGQNRICLKLWVTVDGQRKRKLPLALTLLSCAPGNHQVAMASHGRFQNFSFEDLKCMCKHSLPPLSTLHNGNLGGCALSSCQVKSWHWVAMQPVEWEKGSEPQNHEKSLCFVCNLCRCKASVLFVIEMAKAAVKHFGPTTCPVISKLAAADPKKGEEVAHKVFLAQKPARD